MGFVRLLFFLGVFVLSLKLEGADGSGGTPNTTLTHKAKRLDCRDALNTARTKIGFPIFEDPGNTKGNLLLGGSTDVKVTVNYSVKPKSGQSAGSADDGTKQKAFLTSVCSAILGEQQRTSSALADQAKGTYMYAPQSSDTGDCAAAVKHWEAARSNFQQLPKGYSQDETLYAKSENISFVGLYNPNEKPTLDCAVFTCEAQAVASEKVQSDILDQVPGTDSATAKKKVHGLVCLSSPQALPESEAPFTQAQWNKITGVENATTHPTVFAAVVLSVAGLMDFLN